jgi:hypothetical protein
MAWLYTGPLGHLVAGIADWVALLARSRHSTGVRSGAGG